MMQNDAGEFKNGVLALAKLAKFSPPRMCHDGLG